jgi:hypothetical protein
MSARSETSTGFVVMTTTFSFTSTSLDRLTMVWVGILDCLECLPNQIITASILSSAYTALAFTRTPLVTYLRHLFASKLYADIYRISDFCLFSTQQCAWLAKPQSPSLRSNDQMPPTRQGSTLWRCPWARLMTLVARQLHQSCVL